MRSVLWSEYVTRAEWMHALRAHNERSYRIPTVVGALQHACTCLLPPVNDYHFCFSLIGHRKGAVKESVLQATITHHLACKKSLLGLCAFNFLSSILSLSLSLVEKEKIHMECSRQPSAPPFSPHSFYVGR
ncbi:hypothetical protein ACTXT7_003114 [Hymenolepis weldensis]